MKALKEALIGSHNINNTNSFSIQINKKEFSTGDIVITRRKEIGVVIFLKDIKDENLYDGIIIGNAGSIVNASPFTSNYFYGLDLDSYRDNGTSTWDKKFDIIKIIKNAISIDICKDPTKLYSELTNKFNFLKESISESLIGSHNINNSLRGCTEIRKDKSKLRDGDLCQQRDTQIGIYNSNPNYKLFKLNRSSSLDHQGTLIFYSPNNEYDSDFQHYPIMYYTADLRDEDGEKDFDVIKVIRGLFDPNDVNDPKKVKEFFIKESDLEKYFL